MSQIFDKKVVRFSAEVTPSYQSNQAEPTRFAKNLSEQTSRVATVLYNSYLESEEPGSDAAGVPRPALLRTGPERATEPIFFRGSIQRSTRLAVLPVAPKFTCRVQGFSFSKISPFQCVTLPPPPKCCELLTSMLDPLKILRIDNLQNGVPPNAPAGMKARYGSLQAVSFSSPLLSW